MRAGKGKMRNRRFTQRRGPLIIYNRDNGIVRAFRNIPGIELCHVNSLNLLQLAPGGHLGRFCIWTKSAFEKLDKLFGTFTRNAKGKHGFRLARSMMLNADLQRVINSDEIQTILRKKKASKTHRKLLKKNPLRNLGVLLKLNPYAKTLRRKELLRSYVKKEAAPQKPKYTKEQRKAFKKVSKRGKQYYQQFLAPQ